MLIKVSLVLVLFNVSFLAHAQEAVKNQTVELQVTQAICHSNDSAPLVSTLNHETGVEADFNLSTLKCLTLEDKMDDASAVTDCRGAFVMAKIEVDVQAHRVLKIISAEVVRGNKCN